MPVDHLKKTLFTHAMELCPHAEARITDPYHMCSQFTYHSIACSEVNDKLTRKMVPIPRRASSFLVVVVNRKEEEEDRTTTTVYQRL